MYLQRHVSSSVHFQKLGDDLCCKPGFLTGSDKTVYIHTSTFGEMSVWLFIHFLRWATCVMNLSFFTDSANYSADYSVRPRNKKYTHVHLLTTTSSSKESELLRGASKIKLKKVNKKRMATARRLIFFLISQGIHCWSDYTVVFINTKLWRQWRRRQQR